LKATGQWLPLYTLASAIYGIQPFLRHLTDQYTLSPSRCFSGSAYLLPTLLQPTNLHSLAPINDELLTGTPARTRMCVVHRFLSFMMYTSTGVLFLHAPVRTAIATSFRDHNILSMPSPNLTTFLCSTSTHIIETSFLHM